MQSLDLSHNSIAGQLHPIVYATKEPDCYSQAFGHLLLALEKTCIKRLTLVSIGMGPKSAGHIAHKLIESNTAAHMQATIELLAAAHVANADPPIAGPDIARQTLLFQRELEALGDYGVQKQLDEAQVINRVVIFTALR